MRAESRAPSPNKFAIAAQAPPEIEARRKSTGSGIAPGSIRSESLREKGSEEGAPHSDVSIGGSSSTEVYVSPYCPDCGRKDPMGLTYK